MNPLGMGQRNKVDEGRMGLNMTSYGELVTVTPGQTLDLPMAPKEGCLWTGQWVATYGAEDPRLFWTVSCGHDA